MACFQKIVDSFHVTMEYPEIEEKTYFTITLDKVLIERILFILVIVIEILIITIS